jgi:hypothetical protein
VDLSSIKPGYDLHLTERFLSEGGWSNSWKYHRSSSKKQREIWAHGNDLLLKTNPSQQDLAAALIQFQRAVELRDKLLDKLYGFEKIPGRPNPGKYAIMSDLGIIRPTLKIRLRELRNKLMHDPNEIHVTQDECTLLADAAWYYLRVTDRIAEQCSDEIHYDLGSSATGQSGLTVKVEPVSWKLDAAGFLGHDHILEAATAGGLNLRVLNCEFQRYNNSLKVAGELIGPPKSLWSVIQNFFDESVL